MDARAARALVASMLLSVLPVRVHAECQACTIDNAHSGHWYVVLGERCARRVGSLLF